MSRPAIGGAAGFALALTVGCVATEPPVPTAADSDLLLVEDFDDGLDDWIDWNQSPGWVGHEDGALVIRTRSADHDRPLHTGDDEYTFGALAAHCPRRDDEGRCMDTGWGSYVVEVSVNTRAQVRAPLIAGENLPAAWEVAWIFFQFQDVQHYYFMLFKTRHAREPAEDFGGVEIGKYNCPRNCGVLENASGKETLLYVPAAEAPVEDLAYLDLDRWYRYRIEVEEDVAAGTITISVFVDGQLAGRVVDDGTIPSIFGGLEPTPPLFDGGIGLYAEDSEAWFDDVVVRQTSP